MDRFQEMASFVAVVEAGSFVAAADALGLSKAAVSRHVGDLEKRLGARLLHRTTRRLSLTDDGQRFYARAKEMLAAVDEAESEISSRSGEPSGLLRIGAPLTFGVLHLAPLWPRFLAAHPKVSLEVALSDRIADLVEEGFDLAVRITNLPDSQLVSRRLATTRMVACASPGYLAAHGAPAHPHDLARHAVVGYTYWAAKDEWTFSADDGSTASVRTRPRLVANNGDTCRAAALAGHGIVLQPDFIVAGDLRAGALVEVLPGWRALSLGIHAVYPSRKYLPIRTRRMLDFLAEAFATTPWDG